MLVRWWMTVVFLCSIATSVYAVNATCPAAGEDRAAEAKIAASLMVWPSPPFVAIEGTGQSRFMMTNDLFAEILGQPERALLLNDAEELRYLPFTLAGSSILLVLREAQNWSETKARRVEKVALLSAIKISLVWLSSAEIPASLQALVMQSGGRVWRQDELLARIRSYTCSLPLAQVVAPPPPPAI